MYKYIFTHVSIYIYIKNYPILVSSFVLVKGPHAGYSNPRYQKISILYYWHSASLGQDFEANPIIPFWLSGGRRCATAQLTRSETGAMDETVLVTLARVAERAERYDEMADFMKQRVAGPGGIGGKPRSRWKKMIEKPRSRMLYMIFSTMMSRFSNMFQLFHLFGGCYRTCQTYGDTIFE